MCVAFISVCGLVHSDGREDNTHLCVLSFTVLSFRSAHGGPLFGNGYILLLLIVMVLLLTAEAAVPVMTVVRCLKTCAVFIVDCFGGGDKVCICAAGEDVHRDRLDNAGGGGTVAGCTGQQGV
jgi:hypothetical protein